MSVVIKSVYGVASSVFQAIIHVILRDLTNYYWEKEKAELEQKQEVSSIQEEIFPSRPIGDIVALTAKTKETKDEIKEHVMGYEINYKGGNSDRFNTRQNIDEDNTCIENQGEIINLIPCNKQSYTVEALGDNIERNFEDKKELSKVVEVLREDIYQDNFILMKCVDSENTLDTVLLNHNSKINTESEDECGIHLLLEKLSYCLQTADNAILETPTDIKDNNQDSICGGCIESKTSHEVQDNDHLDENSNEVCQVFEEYTFSDHQSIENDHCSRCPDEKFNSNESNLVKEQKILNENIQKCCSEKEKTKPLQSTNKNMGPLLLNVTLEDGFANNLNNKSKSHEDPSETTGLIETFSDIDSNCYDDDWVRRFLSNEQECASKQNNENTDAHTESCECSRTHSCLQALDCDDQIETNAELLTDEELRSVETGSVSDWLYSVSPAICLLPANDIICATPEEFHSLNNDQESVTKHKPETNPNEHMLRNFYVKQWLDNTKSYCGKSLPKYKGSGDFL